MTAGLDTVVERRDADAAEELAIAALALARAYAAGATLWCVAPQWPDHGRHVAVEFVHPVIVGKRALPAVHLSAPTAVPALRSLARPGDVLLAVGSACDARATELLARAEAWGLTRMWLGVGPRPPVGRADHVIWLDGVDPGEGSRSGDIVLHYHLLWELTHVVFEHPGLLEPEAAPVGEVCITCSDEGRVAEVSAIRPDGLVDAVVNGRREAVDASLVDPVVAGDLVLVHAGVVLTTLPGASRAQRGATGAQESP
jgi:hydrogenase maturation factor